MSRKSSSHKQLKRRFSSDASRWATRPVNEGSFLPYGFGIRSLASHIREPYLVFIRLSS